VGTSSAAGGSGATPIAGSTRKFLRGVVEEAARLLQAEGALLYLIDAADGTLHLAHDAGITERAGRTWARQLRVPLGSGVFGRAVAERRVVATGDYPQDPDFPHVTRADRYVRQSGIRSVIAAPLVDGPAAFGALGVVSTRENAYGMAETALIRALADHAAVSVSNARLIEELRRSRGELRRQAESERALREMAAGLAAIRDPTELLSKVVHDVRRLVEADWTDVATVDMNQRICRVCDSGMGSPELERQARELELRVGEGLRGTAVAERRLLATGDYLADNSFGHTSAADSFARLTGFRSRIAAPLITDRGAVGVLAVYAKRPHAFATEDLALVGAFASHAAVAMGNASLIDELVQSRVELEESEARYRYLVKASPDVVWATDEKGVITFVSDRLEPLTGYQPDEVLGQSYGVLATPGSLEVLRDTWGNIQRDPSGVHVFPLLLQHKTGLPIPVEVWATGLSRDGHLAGAHGSMRDVREREHLEGELRRHAAELAASEERAHLARELHDSVTQALFSMTLVTRSVELLLEKDVAEAGRKLLVLRDLQRDALAEMRALIFELRPASLEREGLVAALRTHVAAVQGRSGLPISLEVQDTDRLPLEIESALFRIAQEALNNVLKHAGPCQVGLQLGRSSGAMRLVVEDDGVGFDPAAVTGVHLGLEGMRARADSVHGQLTIRSARGEGTRIEVTVPVPGPTATVSAMDGASSELGPEGPPD
jgi:PAS domain S-box-containing protein